MSYYPIDLAAELQLLVCEKCGAVIADAALHDRTHRCCAGGPQWGHAFDCPSLR